MPRRSTITILYGVGRSARGGDTCPSRGSSATLVHGDQSQRSKSGERARRLHAAVARELRHGSAAEDSCHRRRGALCTLDRGDEFRRPPARARDRARRGVCVACCPGREPTTTRSRQQLVQALLLATIGTALGLLVASWTTPVLFALSPEGADATGSAMREFDYAARLDLPVFAFATGVMVHWFGFWFAAGVRALLAPICAERSAFLARCNPRPQLAPFAGLLRRC